MSLNGDKPVIHVVLKRDSLEWSNMACILVSSIYLVKQYEGLVVMLVTSYYIVMLLLDLDRIFVEGDITKNRFLRILDCYELYRRKKCL